MSLVKHKFRLKDGTQVESKDWYYRFTYKGKTYFASTRTPSRQIAGRVEKARLDQLVAFDKLGQEKVISVQHAFSNWLSTVKTSSQYINYKTGAAKMMGSKRDTTTGGTSMVLVKVYGFDSAKPFHELNTADVQNLIVSRRDEGNSIATILNELSMLRTAIQVNANLKYLVPTIDFAGLKKTNKLKPPKQKLRHLSPEEEHRFPEALNPANFLQKHETKGFLNASHIREARQDAYDLAITLLDLGCRYGEASSLKISSVDLNTRSVELFRSKVDNESRLYISDRLYAVLKRRIENAEAGQEYVFLAKNGEQRNYAPRVFRSAFKRAGIEGASIKTLRRTLASKLVLADVPIYSVSKILGHASVTTTQNHYGHLSPNAASAKAVEVLNALSRA